MQGKGIVKFFLVVMALVTIVQYLFIIPTQRVEREAEEYAQTASDTIKDARQQREAFKRYRSAYLDSLSTETVFQIPLLKSYTYQELKKQQLALGLDLKGGMSVVLQVDLREFIRTLAQNSKDPKFEEALNQASKAQQNTQEDFVSLFSDAWAEVSDGKPLAPIFQRNEALRDEITFNTSNNEVTALLREKATEAVDLTFQLLKQRIDQLGVVQPNVSLDAERDLIVVELPDVDNPARAREILQAAANLEFYDIYNVSEAGIAQAFLTANEQLANTLGEGEGLPQEVESIDPVYGTDSLGNIDSTQIIGYDTTYQNNIAQGPLLSIFTPNFQGGATLGIAERNQRNNVLSMLRREEIRRLFPNDLAFRWSRNPIPDLETGESGTQYELYGVKIPRDGKAPLTGDHVTDASAQPNPTNNQIGVTLGMDNTGAKIWARMTTAAANDNNRQIAILLDSQVVSAPRVQNAITGGNTEITGDFTMQEATDLANILEIGRLPARTEIIQESLVGPSLGAENIRRSITALVVGFAIVLAFMIFYYGGAGIISIIALILNIIFIFGALASLNTVLTLPGIAGIVLTIGMAVDANVIIYERIREELRAGKTLKMAVADGFKNSYSAIIDANVTTILTAFILAYFGLGPIKGFAVVLIVGIVFSLFTAVLVTRLALDYWLGKDRNISFSTASSANWFANLNIDWLGKRRIAYVISGTILAVSLVSFFTRGFELGVDFRGGYSYNIQFEEPVDAQELRASLTDAFEGITPVVKAVDTENTYNVVTSYKIDAPEENDGKPEELVMAALHQGVQAVTDADIDLAEFSAADGTGTHITTFSKVGPTIADDIKRSALYAAVFALLMIFLYIFLRFSKWQYSLGAVAALFHDSLIVLGLFSLLHGLVPFNLEIDQAFIAAILTVIGYSINDTVIVFDRIREYLGTFTKGSKEELINAAINSTVSRTIITSLTTFFVVAVLFFFGGTSIRGFAFAILVGIIVGTYSSIFVATPIVNDLTDDLQAKKKTSDKKERFSKAAGM